MMLFALSFPWSDFTVCINKVNHMLSLPEHSIFLNKLCFLQTLLVWTLKSAEMSINGLWVTNVGEEVGQSKWKSP